MLILTLGSKKGEKENFQSKEKRKTIYQFFGTLCTALDRAKEEDSDGTSEKNTASNLNGRRVICEKMGRREFKVGKVLCCELCKPCSSRRNG